MLTLVKQQAMREQIQEKNRLGYTLQVAVLDITGEVSCLSLIPF
jgi:hypothetical protein